VDCGVDQSAQLGGLVTKASSAFQLVKLLFEPTRFAKVSRRSHTLSYSTLLPGGSVRSLPHHVRCTDASRPSDARLCSALRLISFVGYLVGAAV